MRFLALLFLILLFPSFAFSGPLEDGRAAYKRQDYKIALKLLQPLADQGNLESQMTLGWIYLRGEGVKQDNAEALFWYLLAEYKIPPTYGMAWAVFHGDAARPLTDAQIKSVKDRVAEWKPTLPGSRSGPHRARPRAHGWCRPATRSSSGRRHRARRRSRAPR